MGGVVQSEKNAWPVLTTTTVQHLARSNNETAGNGGGCTNVTKKGNLYSIPPNDIIKIQIASRTFLR